MSGARETPPEEIRELADKVRAEGADTVAEWLEETAEEREEGDR